MLSPALSTYLSLLALVGGVLNVLVNQESRESKPHVFVFLLECNASVWNRMDWEKITTVALAGWVDGDLVEAAHSRQTKVVFIPDHYPKDLGNESERRSWITNQLNYSDKFGLDGLNFDFEDEVGYDDARGYADLVEETSKAFKSYSNNSQISIDYGWTPGADKRNYLYKEMADNVDIVFVMGYDTQSQMFGTGLCRARPNSPLFSIFRGIQKYIQLGISKKKMILGVPWYGYKYPCVTLKKGVCVIMEVPFRGCNCSDAAGKEFAYKDVLEMENKSLTGTHWDNISKTPFFETLEDGQIYQVWFDNPTSLSTKYKIGVGMGLLGVGFWTGNYLDYDNQTMRQQMWSILP